MRRTRDESDAAVTARADTRALVPYFLVSAVLSLGYGSVLTLLGEIRDRFQKVLQAVVDAGACPMTPTTVLDLSGDEPVLVRQGRGDLAKLGL